MKRLLQPSCLAVLLLASCALSYAETPIVSTLTTLSIHVDNPETYNSLFRLFAKDLQWPVIYGEPWTPERKGRRSYAGVWAGNVVLEVCGPYAGESFPENVRARLHGLTFRPHDTADASAAELHRLGIGHKPPVTWSSSGKPEDNLRFVYLEDAGLTGPALAVSIQQVTNREREQSEQAAARAALSANHGGPLGLKSLREIQVVYPDAQTFRKWQGFLIPGGQSQSDRWPGGEGPALRFIQSAGKEIAAIVVQVESTLRARTFLRAHRMLAAPTGDHLEIDRSATHGVRIILTQ